MKVFVTWGTGFKCVMFLLLVIGCTQKIPCYPPEYYAPEHGAPYTAEELRIQTPKGYHLAGTLTLPSLVQPPYPAVLFIPRPFIGNARLGVTDSPVYRPIVVPLGCWWSVLDHHKENAVRDDYLFGH